uniref:Secondary thiamine-phosphate synthase enzyme n=1 Tax=Aegilops tauschii subsp. strangulata TaxID=200361 RepID=A0A453NPH8_AEGTS
PAPWPPSGPRRPSSSLPSAAAATSSPPRFIRPQSHPSRSSPHRLVRKIQGFILLLIAILLLLCRALQVLREIEGDLSGFKCGLAHLFLQHTSASLTINENYDSDVQADTETFLNKIVPEGRSAPWKHTMEGPDDMPAHIKSSMFGCALAIPITDGHLNLGTWQGIWLCEHRDHASARKIVVTLNGI